MFLRGPNSGDISKSLNIYKIDQFQFLRRPDWKAAGMQNIEHVFRKLEQLKTKEQKTLIKLMAS